MYQDVSRIKSCIELPPPQKQQEPSEKALLERVLGCWGIGNRVPPIHVF